MYRFRREGKMLQWHGPSVFTINSWDHSGTRLDSFANVNWRFMLSGVEQLRRLRQWRTRTAAAG